MAHAAERSASERGGAARLRALIVDVDGVVVRHPSVGWRWDIDLEADLGVRPEDLHSNFFVPHWRDVVLGRASLRERLAPVLAQIAPAVSADELIVYWLARDAHIDQALLADLATVRRGGIELHLVTVQEHERAAHLWTTLGLRQHFDAIHYSAAMGLAKPDPACFNAVAARTSFAPNEMLLVDDDARNVAAAASLGWHVFLWTPGARLATALAGCGEPHPSCDRITTL